MKFKHIEIFHAIMLAGTVSGAARLLKVSQPAVSRALQNAEIDLGYKLFKRANDGLIPTGEAIRLHVEVKNLVSQMQSLRKLSIAIAERESVKLQVLVIPSLASRALPNALLNFRKIHPHLEVAVRVCPSQLIGELITRQDADIGIVYGSDKHPTAHEIHISTGHLVYVSKLEKSEPKIDSTVTLAEVARDYQIEVDDFSSFGRTFKNGETTQIANTFRKPIFNSHAIDTELSIEIKALLPLGQPITIEKENFIKAFKIATS